jgi:hypothetical protein
MGAPRGYNAEPEGKEVEKKSKEKKKEKQKNSNLSPRGAIPRPGRSA